MSLIIKNDNLLKDIKVIENEKFFDERGFFSKIFHKEIKKNLKINIDEIFYSVNKKGVIRGIHYQKKDKQLGKIVGCLDGEILDFFIDLRKDSETYGKFSSEIINSKNNISIFVPEGFGHGFSVLSKSATVIYLQSGDYDPKHEGGINPLSIDFDWNVDDPILSERDSNHPRFNLNNQEFKL
tara:strand:+ start:353 stop:898 length:546 start_codon:yes stop_codon:yes gene_type:complete